MAAKKDDWLRVVFVAAEAATKIVFFFWFVRFNFVVRFVGVFSVLLLFLLLFPLLI